MNKKNYIEADLLGGIEDNINHPSYYTDGAIEVIDFIEDKKLPYHLGNVIKYISRAGKKNPETELEDLKKAHWYLSRYICIKEQKNGRCPPIQKNGNFIQMR